MATITTTNGSLLRLLQLASPALPIGGYAFSQGMETAVDEGWLLDRASTQRWLHQQIALSLTCIDLPMLLRQHRVTRSGDVGQFDYNNAWVLACRETAELRLSDTAMGTALARLLSSLGITLPSVSGELSFVSGFAFAAAHWDIDELTCCQGFLWSWLENQAAAATKLVPLGQTDAQKLLSDLQADIEIAIEHALAIDDADIGGSLPALALASCRHEFQYSRLFRS